MGPASIRKAARMRDLRYEFVRRVFKLRPPRAARVEYRKNLSAPMSTASRCSPITTSPTATPRHHSCSCAAPTGAVRVIGLVARALAYEGFQVVVQSCRGTAGSGGRFDRPFRAEADDGRDTVAWLREQPFYPGRFATFCASYLGYVQLAPARVEDGPVRRRAPGHAIDHPGHRVAGGRGARAGVVARLGDPGPSESGLPAQRPLGSPRPASASALSARRTAVAELQVGTENANRVPRGLVDAPGRGRRVLA